MHLRGHLYWPKISKKEKNPNDMNLVPKGKYRKRAKNGVFEKPARFLGTKKMAKTIKPFLFPRKT